MNRRQKLFTAIALMWASFAQAADPTSVSVRDLSPRSVRMDEAGGTTKDIAIGLNAYATAGGVGTRRQQLYIDGGLWGAKATIDLSQKESFAIRGNGLGDTRALPQFAVGERAAMQSAICWTNERSVTGPLLKTSGFIDLSGTNWYGSYSTTTLDALTSRSHARYCAVGILVPGRGDADLVGTGKLYASTLGMHCFQTAIELGDGRTGTDNADMLCLGFVRFNHCDVGIHAVAQQHQAIDHWIGKVDGSGCQNIFYFEKGGKLECGQVTCAYDGGIMLRTRAQGFDDGWFRFGSVNIDGTNDSEFTVWQHDAEGEGETVSPCTVDIGCLMLAFDVELAPAFKLRAWNKLIIRGGGLLREGMVQVNGGTLPHPVIVLIDGAQFYPGEDPRNLIYNLDGASDGYAIVRVVNAIDADGSFIPTKYYRWVNGVITDL